MYKYLIINTLDENDASSQELTLFLNETYPGCEIIHTAHKNIRGCIGCNECWLKTPGLCCIKDDYGDILKKIQSADRVWFITGISRFGFVSFQMKNMIDRFVPLATMYLHFRNGQMRHIRRYEHVPEIGLFYVGEGKREYLSRWLERVALNFDMQSMGVYAAEHKEEVLECI